MGIQIKSKGALVDPVEGVNAREALNAWGALRAALERDEPPQPAQLAELERLWRVGVKSLTDSPSLNSDATLTTCCALWLAEGYALLDVNNNTVDEPYYSEWNRDIYSINQFYERMKWLTRDGSAYDPLRRADIIGFSATSEISRAAFGIDRFSGLLTDTVRIEIEAEFIRQTPD